jgi:hypothetical protein
MTNPVWRHGILAIVRRCGKKIVRFDDEVAGRAIQAPVLFT